ncbi:hypothetical protein C6Q11_05165 [Burkholderia multivorans]|uniref:glycine-rich domain-containing protein n=1 Tax=Burkholderia multivorans TaxID=87883 RepID=UPI000CFF08C6|nr:hypothetical protein [Burkholderia multivorans]PRF55312.1 hypothetical protein C6Q11_05165 [Burkholderia multivorans]
MDRQTVYAGQVPLETDLLNTNRNVLVAIGKMLGDMLGTSTFATGLGCVATSPASMNVQVQPGQLYSLQNLDNTAYSSLAADTTHQIVKQGIMLDAQSFSCPAPTTAGYSINYLIEANYADVDTNAVVLPFYNASNPSQAFNGPGGNGQPSMTTRAGKVILTLKPGVAAATGSQITPAVDSGCVGLWVVTVAYGQSTITSSNISQYAGAPILPTSLLQSLITNNLEYGVDSGPANAVQATFPIAPSSVVDNQQFWVKIKSANTGATTFTPNPGVIGAAPVVGAAHQALQGGELVANGRALFVYRADIASYVLESCTGAPLQTAPATQSQHAVQLGQLFGGLKGIGRWAGAGTYQWTVPANVTTVYASGTAPGGGGGAGGSGTVASSPAIAGGGGGGGAGQSIVRQPYTVVPGSTVTITIGTPGSGGTAVTTGNGSPGGTAGNLVISGSGFNGGTPVTLTGGSGGGGGSAVQTSSGGAATGGGAGSGYPAGSYGNDTSAGYASGSGGAGASGPFGGGGGAARTSTAGSLAGGNAYGYGAGGGGGAGVYSSNAGNGGGGGSGAPGFMTFEW